MLKYLLTQREKGGCWSSLMDGPEHRQPFTEPLLFRVENPQNPRKCASTVRTYTPPVAASLQTSKPCWNTGTQHLGVICSHLAAAHNPAEEELGYNHLSSATRAEHVCCACTPRSGCNTSLTHPKQGMWHKYLLSQRMVPLEGNKHQGLMPPMQRTHCRWVTNPTITLVLRNSKCWAVTNSHRSAPSGTYKMGSFASNEILTSEKLNPLPQKFEYGISGYDGCACHFLCVSPSWTLHSTVNSLQSSH